MPDPLLCWCCARYGLTTPAIVAGHRLCAYCLTTPRTEGEASHIQQALTLAGTPAPPQPATLFDPS